MCRQELGDTADLRYSFESYVFDSDRRELRRDATLIAVEPQVFDLLEYLIRNRARVVSRDDLIQSIWGGRIVSESALSTRINAARTARAQATLGLCLDLLGQHREGAQMMEQAIALHPRDLHVRFYLPLIARAFLVDRDYCSAEAWARRAIENNPMIPRTRLILAATLGHLGRTQEAQAELDAAEHLAPGFAGRWLSRAEYRSDAENEHVAEGLRKAGFRVNT